MTDLGPLGNRWNYVTLYLIYSSNLSISYVTKYLITMFQADIDAGPPEIKGNWVVILYMFIVLHCSDIKSNWLYGNNQQPVTDC